MAFIKGKQLADTLRSESDPFDTIYVDKTVGDLNGAIRFTALNNTGSTIGAYKVVYINGVSGNTPTIALADADTSSMPAFGLTVAQVTTGNEVDVITFGNLKGVDTSLLAVGDVLYVSTTAGEYTITPPAGSSAKLQNIGMVVKSDSNGIIKVGGAGRSAATPNLDEGHFFLGNASNQSVQSSYQLPTSIGTNGYVLASNGTDLVFQESASGSSITTQRISTNSITAQKDYRYLIDYNSLTAAISVTLPASPSTGDTIYFLPRYNNRLSFSSAGTEVITRAGFTPEPYTEYFNLTSGIEIKAVYSGTEWVVESPTKELYQWTSNTSINISAFLRYDTILLPYATATYALPDESTVPDGSYLEIIFTQSNANSNTKSVVTFTGYNGNNEVGLAGVNSPSSPVSSVEIINPRLLKIYKYASSFIILNPLNAGLNGIKKNSLLYTSVTSSSSLTAAANHHYILESTASTIAITLPAIDDVEVGDEILFSKNSTVSPGIVTVSLDATDASTANIYIQAPGLSRINQSSVNSVSVPLTTGTLAIKKIYDNGTTKEYLLTLLQSGAGPTLDVTTTTQTVDIGYNYLVNTATAGGAVTITLPYVDAETVTYESFIKVVDDTYDVVIAPDGAQVTIDDSNNSITLSAGSSKDRCLTFIPTAEYDWKLIADTHPTSSSSDLTSVSSNITPSTANTYSLGSSTAEWSDLYLGDSSRIYFGNDQDVFLEHLPDAGLTLDMSSAETNFEPVLKLVSQGSSATIGPTVDLFYDKTAPTTTNRLGQIRFSGKDDAGNLTYYGYVGCKPLNDTNGSEVGEIFLSPWPAAGTSNTYGLSIEGVAGDSGKAFVNVDVHNGTDSGLKLNGTLVTSIAAELNVLDVSSEAPSDNDVLTYTTASGLHWSTISSGFTYSAITVNTTAQANYHYSCTGTITLTLPTSGINAGEEIRVKNMGTGTITIARNGVLIDGVASDYTLNTQYSSVTFVYTGTNYEVV